MKLLIAFVLAQFVSLSGFADLNKEKALAHVQRAYKEAALVVLADVRLAEKGIVVEPTETWRSAPGYKAEQIIIPEEHGVKLASDIKKAVVCFYLKRNVGHFEMFYVRDGRVDFAPDLPLADLHHMLEAGLTRSVLLRRSAQRDAG